MTRLILEKLVLPRREYNGFGSVDQGDPWTDEVQEAQDIAGRWGAQWFTPAEAERWLRVHRDKIGPELARRLADSGITPEQAALRIWYGKINNQRPPIADRVSLGDITPEQARLELEALRLDNS